MIRNSVKVERLQFTVDGDPTQYDEQFYISFINIAIMKKCIESI